MATDVIVFGKVTRSNPATHAIFEANEGAGGFMTVADAAARLALTSEQKRAYMKVTEEDTGNEYQLQPNGTWVETTPSDYMTKTVYDTDEDGRVNAADHATLAANSELLDGHQYSEITDAIDLKLDAAEKGADLGVCELDEDGFIPNGRINTPLAGNWKNSYNATTGLPAISDGGVHNIGDLYRVGVAGTQDLGSGNIVMEVRGELIYSGTVWEYFPPAATGVQQINGDNSANQTLDLDDMADTATRFAMTADENAAIVGTSGTPPSGANKLVDNADTRLTNSRAPNGAAGGDLAGSYPNPTIGAGKVVTAMVADLAITGAKIANSTVSAGKLASNAVTTAKVVDGAITDAKITSLAYTKLTGAPSALAPTGAAGGNLGGTYPNPTVVGLTISGQATGDIIYFNGTNWVRLAPGTAGYVLKTNGAGVAPSWGVDATAGTITGLAFNRVTHGVTGAIADDTTVAAATATDIVLTLPASATYTGGQLLVKDEGTASTGTNGIEIACAGADTFEDGSTSQFITTDKGSVWLYTDGAGVWYKIDENL